MCTVTFYPGSDHHYRLSMNRDEARTRARADPPKAGICGKTPYLRPIDGSKGGTWIGVNRYGVSMCLMNHYQAPQPGGPETDFISRGWLIPNLMDAADLQDLRRQMAHLSLKRIKPFRLLVVQPDPLEVMIFQWNMRNIESEEQEVRKAIWTSAGQHASLVQKVRSQVFEDFWKEKQAVTLDNIKALHATQLPEPGPLAISMSHPKAMSVSNTIIEVSAEKAVMHYLDGFPADSTRWHESALEQK